MFLCGRRPQVCKWGPCRRPCWYCWYPRFRHKKLVLVFRIDFSSQNFVSKGCDKIESAGKLGKPRLGATKFYYSVPLSPALLLLDDSTLVVAGATNHEAENDVEVDFCKLDERTFKERDPIIGSNLESFIVKVVFWNTSSFHWLWPSRKCTTSETILKQYYSPVLTLDYENCWLIKDNVNSVCCFLNLYFW